jgi:hypothetical protein
MSKVTNIMLFDKPKLDTAAALTTVGTYIVYFKA